ncbi:MAG: hemerythrin domain-containing protein [Proteobacteria bacterium]|nr:hemerythrin domain-containing protein [Pseudomonadota bacterium]
MALPACAKREDSEGEEGVSAVEDLMREHGILRRLLIVYRECAAVLRSGASLDAAALAQASDLFRTFGEDYHERQLEETRIFPALMRAGGEAAGLVDTLIAQHQRGRAINAFIKERCASGRVADQRPLAASLDAFARMYEAHAAYEDTIVFQAWKRRMSADQLREVGDQFEDIERSTFHGDGFDMALDQVSQIEQRLRLHDLSRFTAPAP